MDKKTRMFSIISDFDSSGLDRKSFCKLKGLTLNIFCYWRGKWLAEQKMQASSKTNSSSFIRIEKEPEGSQDNYEIIYPNGVRLRLTFLDFKVLPQLINLV